MNVQAFVTELGRTEVGEDSFNQYAGPCPAGGLRRHNLRRYLAQMLALEPTVLLVGEAAGYRGCRLTGIPFTSERVLVDDPARVGLLGRQRGYRLCNQDRSPHGEATATIVWTALRRFRTLPLLWNAYPFHPHRPGRPQSNRKPRVAEVLETAPFLRRLLAGFPIRDVVAVGRTAEQTLTRLGITHRPVRHPSHGGKQAFLAGLARWMTPP